MKYKQPASVSRTRKREQAIWQRRFWEHQLRDVDDFSRHIEYIHYNPVKHGLVDAPLGNIRDTSQIISTTFIRPARLTART